MNYRQLKSLTTGLLTGDMKLPQEDDVLLALLEKALFKVASRAQVLRLMTDEKSSGILRTADGNYYIRFPNLPEKDSDDIDVDHELAFAVASYIASFVCRLDMKPYHIREAEETIDFYNNKYSSIIKQIYEQINGNTAVVGIPSE